MCVLSAVVTMFYEYFTRKTSQKIKLAPLNVPETGYKIY